MGLDILLPEDRTKSFCGHSRVTRGNAKRKSGACGQQLYDDGPGGRGLVRGANGLPPGCWRFFGCAALLLCIFGIYGLLAYQVTQRTRELGLRIALSAQRGDVTSLVLRQASWMLLAGSGVGLILAYLSSLLLRTFLYGVQPHDPWTMGAVTLLLLVGGLIAANVPARRAASVDPMRALRAD